MDQPPFACGLLSLPAELIALTVGHLLDSFPNEPHDGQFHDLEPRETLRNLCLVHRRIRYFVKPILFRRVVVRTMKQAFALEAALDKMERDERRMIREIIFPLLKTTPCSPSKRGSPAVSCVRAASLLKLTPDVRHFFCFDLRWEPKFEPDTTFDVFSSLCNLRKLSIYIGDSYRASLVLDALLPKLGACKQLTHLDVAATKTMARDGLVDSEAMPPIECLTLIVPQPAGREGHFDLTFWPHFVGRLSPTLKHLASNVGDYLGLLLRRVNVRLQSLTLTPFTEAYEPGWWKVSLPDLRCLSMGWLGWQELDTNVEEARAVQAVEVAVLGGYDQWFLDDRDAIEALRKVARLPSVRKIIATELKDDLGSKMETMLRKWRPEVIFVEVPYGEVDMGQLADSGRIAYKYTPL